MKCPNCDSFVKSSAKVCPGCGVVISKAKGVGKKTSGKGKTGKGGSKKKGGRSKASSKIIDKRGEEDEFLSILQKKSFEEEIIEDKGKDRTKLAAIFLALAGIDAIFSGLFRIAMIKQEVLETVIDASDAAMVVQVARVCGVIMIILGCISFVGVYLIIRKQKWAFCIILCIVGILSLGEIFSASILAAIALIFLILSRKHFQDFKQMDELPPPRL